MKAFALAVSLFLFTCSRTNQQPFVHGQLENGLSYYIMHNAVPEGRALFYLAVRVGSSAESEHQQGIAHFIEHMAFNGTNRFNRGELVSYLSSHYGASFGPDINAHVSFDETVFKLNIPLDRPNALNEVLSLLRDWADGITFNEAEVERERAIIIEEWRHTQNANRRFNNLALPLLLEGTVYANRLPIGQVSQIESFTADDLRSFYEQWYQSHNMAIIAVGDFEVAEVQRAIAEQFNSLPTGRQPPPDTRYPINAGDNRFFVMTDDELLGNSLELYFRSNGRAAIENKADFERDIKDRLVAYMLNERLRLLSTLPQSPLFNPQAGSAIIGHDQFFWVMRTGFREDTALEAYNYLLEVLHQARLFGFNQSELDRALADHLAMFTQQQAEQNHTQSQVHINRLLRMFIYGGRHFTADEALRLYQRVSSRMTLQTLQEHLITLTNTRSYSILASPPHPAIPSETALRQHFINFDSSVIIPFNDSVTNNIIFARPGSGGQITKEEQFDEDILLWTLDNGIQVFVRVGNNTANTVLFQSVVAGGFSDVTNEEHLSAQFSLTLAEESGFGNFSQLGLQQALSGQYVDVAPYVRLFNRGFSGYSSNEHLETLFKLIFLKSYEGINANEIIFTQLKNHFIQSFSQFAGSPEEAFDRVAITALYGDAYNRFFGLINLDDLANINFDSAVNFFAAGFNEQSLADMTYFFSGAVNLDHLRKLVKIYLGSLPPALPASFTPIVIPQPDSSRVHRVHLGFDERADVMVAYAFNSPYSLEDSAYWNIMREMLEMHLIETIRERLNLVYFPNVQLSRLGYGERVNLRILNTTDPAHAEQLVEIIKAETVALLQGFYSDNYYQRALSVLREQELRLRQNDSHYLNVMSLFAEQQLPFSQIATAFNQYANFNFDYLQQFLNRINTNSTAVAAIRLPSN